MILVLYAGWELVEQPTAISEEEAVKYKLNASRAEEIGLGINTDPIDLRCSGNP